jgi:hypothetical protein
MFIKKVDHNVYDCFDGVGWDNWVRMEYKDNLWFVVSGSHRYAERAAFYLNRKINGVY